MIKLVVKKPVVIVPEPDNNKIELSTPTMNSYPIYTGDTLVIPTLNNQELETENTTLKENIKIEKIPYLETSNSAGGNTVIIA